MLLSLLAHKKVTKEMHPAKPLLAEFVRSPRENPLAINSLGFASLRQNCSFIGFSLSSLTGFKGTPFGPVPSYSNSVFVFIGHERL